MRRPSHLRQMMPWWQGSHEQGMPTSGIDGHWAGKKFLLLDITAVIEKQSHTPHHSTIFISAGTASTVSMYRWYSAFHGCLGSMASSLSLSLSESVSRCRSKPWTRGFFWVDGGRGCEEVTAWIRLYLSTNYGKRQTVKKCKNVRWAHLGF